jgi:hypothetical protein
MQHKNPTDIELVNACEEAYGFFVKLSESMGISCDYGVPLRLKNALYSARAEMQLQEDEENSSIVSTVPPSSMD